MILPIDKTEVALSEILADKFKILNETVKEMKEITEDLGVHFPLPEKQILTNSDFCYRHTCEHKRNDLASFLKIVRIISLINASLCLLSNGYATEINMICRAIDEEIEDIELLIWVDYGEPLQIKKDLLNYFYRDLSSSNPNSSSLNFPTDIIRRKEIRSAINNYHEKHKLINENSPDPRKIIYNALSCYVHSRYETIMELYAGPPHSYNMDGSSIRTEISLDYFSYNSIYRSILAILMLCKFIKNENLIKKTQYLHKIFTEQTGMSEELYVKEFISS